MSKLEEIRKKLKSLEKRMDPAKDRPKDNLLYSHWDLKTGNTSTVRFLPDADPNNVFFWRERQLIKIPFVGVKGKPDMKNVVVTVPCADMWDKNRCPITMEIQPWFNDPNLDKLARTFWKKKSYLMQGFVIEDGIGEQASPENPIRKFIISPQIFNIIKAALLDPDMENVPVDYQYGTNFRISKTQKGEYADYSTSSWMRKESSLTQDQLDSIEKFGLFNLDDWMPERPSDTDLQAIKEMFEASIEGELYDPDRWASHYKPWGLDGDYKKAGDDKDDTPSPTPRSESRAPASEEKTETKSTSEVSSNQESATKPKSAEEILNRLRNRTTG